jgi:hypothetical protein
MPIDSVVKREAIETKLVELRKSREQALAVLNAHAGAIEVCEQLLKQADADPAGGDKPVPPSEEAT